MRAELYIGVPDDPVPDVSGCEGEQSKHHALKCPETTCRSKFNLHARPAFSCSSETETANLQLAENRTW
eukprot:CAMPEP_0174359338 /NCGR_PEP_ID=MMETSP0811_2-20130205/48092_1 /TAXON_ID=73025 ORGANISM="Eutreptiella gymnastica-like, Strain CCMP1594" /NCGR_SAMPLE_ID=MMETSP0811_2 /ASSEMBLY_ACC=CAM_ASM_000667 /LENGTH=68 /DNA_ID=CAMNT_0015493985 /DNA_START=209 /DNA_END=415 /DNA_ORIENTATION=+